MRLVVLTTGVYVLAAATLAHAASVRNVTTNTDLAFDNYEGVTPTGGDDDPVAPMGTWQPIESTETQIQVLSNPAAPGAFEGNNFLKVERPTDPQGAAARLRFDEQNTAGEVIHWESMIYVPSSAADYSLFFEGDWVHPTAGLLVDRPRMHVMLSGTGTIDYLPFSEVRTPSGLTFTPDAWVKWEVDYALGGSTFDLTVAGNTATLDIREPGDNLYAVNYFPHPEGLFYFDSTEAIAALTGDLNNDGFVGQDDLSIILGHWGQNVEQGNPLMGDPSNDGFVGQDDLSQVLGGWGQGTPPAVGSLSAVPEPGSLALLGIGVAGLLLIVHRRRRG